MEEIWKDIDGYDGVYQASSFGRLRRVRHDDFRHMSKRLGILKLRRGPRYDLASFCHHGKRTNASLHTIIARTFLSVPPCCPTCKTPYDVNHIDENTHNNRADNLEYVTHVENTRRSRKKQQRASWKILTDEKVAQIKQRISEQVPGVKIAEEFGITKSTVCDISKGRLWASVPFPQLVATL